MWSTLFLIVVLLAYGLARRGILGRVIHALRRAANPTVDLPGQCGWYPDPDGRHDYRWWDGDWWTDKVADPSGESLDPLAAPGAEARTSARAGLTSTSSRPAPESNDASR